VLSAVCWVLSTRYALRSRGGRVPALSTQHSALHTKVSYDYPQEVPMAKGNNARKKETKKPKKDKK
jgi:hypothetical protein